MKKNNKGFSLVELIVVIAIMAVLMVILAPAMLRYVEKTRVQKDESAVSEVANAAELALGDETIYNAAGGASKIIITVPDAGAISATAGGSNFADMASEVDKTTGQVDLVSKTYDGKSATIELIFDPDKQAYVIKNNPSTKKPFTITT